MFRKCNLALMASTGLILLACGGGSSPGNSYTNDVSAQGVIYDRYLDSDNDLSDIEKAAAYEENAAKCYYRNGSNSEFCQSIVNSEYPVIAKWTESELIAKKDLILSDAARHENAGKIRFHLENAGKIKNKINIEELAFRFQSIQYTLAKKENRPTLWHEVAFSIYPDYKLNCRKLIDHDFQIKSSRSERYDNCINVAENVKEVEEYYSLFKPFTTGSNGFGRDSFGNTEIVVKKLKNLKANDKTISKYVELLEEARRDKELGIKFSKFNFAAREKAREERERQEKIDKKRAQEEYREKELKRQRSVKRSLAKSRSSTDLLIEDLAKSNAQRQQEQARLDRDLAEIAAIGRENERIRESRRGEARAEEKRENDRLREAREQQRRSEQVKREEERAAKRRRVEEAEREEERVAARVRAEQRRDNERRRAELKAEGKRDAPRLVRTSKQTESEVTLEFLNADEWGNRDDSTTQSALGLDVWVRSYYLADGKKDPKRRMVGFFENQSGEKWCGSANVQNRPPNKPEIAFSIKAGGTKTDENYGFDKTSNVYVLLQRRPCS